MCPQLNPSPCLFKPSLERLEDRNLMSTSTIYWVPTITSFQYGTKLGPAELNASVSSTGPQNPPVAPLLYLDQNGKGVGMGTVLPAGEDTITAYYGAYAPPFPRMFTVAPAIAPPVLTQVSEPAVILTNPAKPPALTDTVLLSGTTVGVNNTDPVTFTLRVTPNSGLPAYTVTNITNPVANGDGYYSTSYQLSTDELTAAGTYCRRSQNLQ